MHVVGMNEFNNNNKIKTAVAASKCHTPSENKWYSMQDDEAFNLDAVSLQLVYRSQEKLSLHSPLCLSLSLSRSPCIFVVFYHHHLTHLFLIFIWHLCLCCSLNECKHENHLFTFGPHDHCSLIIWGVPKILIILSCPSIFCYKCAICNGCLVVVALSVVDNVWGVFRIPCNQK